MECSDYFDYKMNKRDLNVFSISFNKAYSLFYDRDDLFDNQRYYSDYFDKFLNKKENRMLTDFINYRKDFISSDREAAAFALTFWAIVNYLKKNAPFKK